MSGIYGLLNYNDNTKSIITKNLYCIKLIVFSRYCENYKKTQIITFFFILTKSKILYRINSFLSFDLNNIFSKNIVHLQKKKKI